MNPWSQLNRTLLGNSVESPEEEPLAGTGKGPQSTAKNIYKRKIIRLLTIYIYSSRYGHILKHYSSSNHEIKPKSHYVSMNKTFFTFVTLQINKQNPPAC